MGRLLICVCSVGHQQFFFRLTSHPTPTKMAAASLQDLAAWRKAGFTERDLPSNIEHLIRQMLAIPDEFSFILPDPNLSILDFAAASLIPIDDTVSAGIPDSQELFSPARPCLDVSQLVAVTAPSKSLLINLMARVTQKYLDGMESVILPYTSTLLPLWIIRYWSTLVVHTLPIQQKWKDGLIWLQQPSLSPFPHIVKSVFRSLSSLPWSGDISAEGAFGLVRHSKDILPIYLSREWLNDNHIDQMVCSLNTRITNTPDCKLILLDTVNTRILQRAYQTGGSIQRDVDLLIRFRPRLMMSSIVGGIFHVNGNHWVAAVIIPGKSQILYGDPAGGQPDPILMATLIWFCQQHLKDAPPPSSYTIGTLECPIQNLSTDSWNCGIFSYNALTHFAFPENTTLLQHTENAGFGDAARLSTLVDIVDTYHKEVSVPCIFPDLQD